MQPRASFSGSIRGQNLDEITSGYDEFKGSSKGASTPYDEFKGQLGGPDGADADKEEQYDSLTTGQPSSAKPATGYERPDRAKMADGYERPADIGANNRHSYALPDELTGEHDYCQPDEMDENDVEPAQGAGGQRPGYNRVEDIASHAYAEADELTAEEGYAQPDEITGPGYDDAADLQAAAEGYSRPEDIGGDGNRTRHATLRDSNLAEQIESAAYTQTSDLELQKVGFNHCVTYRGTSFTRVVQSLGPTNDRMLILWH